MIKKTIRNIPYVGNLALKVYSRLLGTDFKTSQKYWEDRYKKGGDSGPGSYNNLAEYKGNVINEFISQNKVGSVMEFGCGDGNQLKYLKIKSYVGYDISKSAIAICTDKFSDDKTKLFKLLNSHKHEQADLTLSLDVIYHLVEDEVFEGYMKRLFSSSNKFVIIYSSNADNHENNGVSEHVKHREFTKWTDLHAPNFELIKTIPNKYSFDGDGNRTSYADFYFFQLKNSNN